MRELFMFLTNSTMIRGVILFMSFDILMGILLSIKLRKITSTVGINGMIRKIGMLAGIVFVIFIDFMLHINIVGWLPQTILDVFENIGLERIGVSDLFGLLFVCFELLSIIKNWTLLGLPMFKGVTEWVKNFLETFTDEMPTTNKNN